MKVFLYGGFVKTGGTSKIHEVDSEASWRLCQVVESQPCETATRGEVNTTKGRIQSQKTGGFTQQNRQVNSNFLLLACSRKVADMSR